MDYNVAVGLQIKKLRLAKKLTLKEVSEATGLSTGFLSQVERGISSIAIDSLAKLTKILGTDISDFIKKNYSSSKEPLVRSFEQPVTQISENIIQYVLSNDPAQYFILPRLFQLLPFASLSDLNKPMDDGKVQEYNHEGEEFIYVLEGVLTVYLKSTKYTLYPGDSIQIHSIFDHNWINHTNKVTKFISINIPNPVFDKDLSCSYFSNNQP